MSRPASKHQGSSAHDFRIAADAIRRRRAPKVLSLRLTPDERAQLERDAAGMTLSAYARERLFGRMASKHAHRRQPIKDDQALARVLASLGRSPVTGALKGVLRASDDGAVVLNVEAEHALRAACAKIDVMRADLITALGLKAE